MHNEKSDDTRKRNKDDPFKSLEEMIKTMKEWKLNQYLPSELRFPAMQIWDCYFWRKLPFNT